MKGGGEIATSILISDFEILQMLKNNSKLTYEDAQITIHMNKREEAKKIHLEACNYAITPPKRTGGRWPTYVKDETRKDGRKKIVKPTEVALLDELVIFYLQKHRTVNMTLEEFYPKWYEYKTSETASTRTLRRHDQHWKKYYEGTELTKTKLSDMNCLMLTKWANNLIRKREMTAEELGNIKTIIIGCLKLAKRMNLIQHNPWMEVEINPRLFRVVHKKTSETQVYLNDELPKLYKIAQQELAKFPERANALAILLNLCLGFRISELVSLRASDIEENYIHINRMETKEETLNPNGTWGKTNEKYGYDSEYLFCISKGRTTSRSITNTIQKFCKHMGIPTKSSHKIRKTVASRLNATGVPLDEIRKILGHTQTATTLGYIFNPFNTKETEKRIENALAIGLDTLYA